MAGIRTFDIQKDVFSAQRDGLLRNKKRIDMRGMIGVLVLFGVASMTWEKEVSSATD